MPDRSLPAAGVRLSGRPALGALGAPSADRKCGQAGRCRVAHAGCAPRAVKVVDLKKAAGQTFSYDELKAALEEHKPAVLFLCQVRPPGKA